MKYRCISYPDFEPNHTWLRQVLLFVDEVHRIVPADLPLNDSDELKRLMEHCEGAVHRCPPGLYVEIPDSQAALFGKALDSPIFRKVADSKTFVWEFGLDGRAEAIGWEFLHVDKIGPKVGQMLSNKGMLRDSPHDRRWQLVPRGVAGLVLSMVADQMAQHNGFDAVTDQPLAFALNGLYGCAGENSAHLEGIVASTVASVHVPKAIALLSASEYAELRKSHSEVRHEFAKLARELKDDARLDRISNPAEFRSQIDGITEHIDAEIIKYRNSKAATKFNDWVPFLMTSLIPVAATLAFGPIPGLVTTGFTFSINATAKATKKSSQFRYPKVLQTLCAAQDLTWQKEIDRLN